MAERNDTAGKKASPKAAERKEYTVKVTTHTHKGEPCGKGDKIDLTAAQAERLQKLKVI